MMSSFFRQLTIGMLVATMLAAPFVSIAHALKAGAMGVTCSCQVSQDVSPHNGNGLCPCEDSRNCCDPEECCHDSMATAHTSGLHIHPSLLQLVHREPASVFPEVYIPIFVPPES